MAFSYDNNIHDHRPVGHHDDDDEEDAYDDECDDADDDVEEHPPGLVLFRDDPVLGAAYNWL